MSAAHHPIPTAQLAFRLFEETRADWLAAARAKAIALAQTNGTVCADDIWDVCPPPREFDGRVVGALFARREWELTGYVKSKRAINHHRPVGVFRLRAAQ